MEKDLGLNIIVTVEIGLLQEEMYLLDKEGSILGMPSMVKRLVNHVGLRFMTNRTKKIWSKRKKKKSSNP